MKLKYIIVDDEPKARLLLRHYLDEIENLIFINEFKNSQKIEEFLLKNEIDLIIIDIEMPGELGTNFIRNLQTKSQIIFCTAHHNYAHEAFDLDAIDYIVKPITKKRLKKAIEKAFERKKLIQLRDINTPNRNDIITLKKGNKNRLIHIDQIIYIEAAGDYIKYFLINDMFMIKKTMKNALKELDKQFIQVHRSFIINTIFLHSISSTSVQLKHNIELPIGRAYRSGIKSIIN